MASSPAAALLTESHRLAQERIGAETALQSMAAWRMLDLDDLDRSARPWLDLMRAVIGTQRAKSAALAGNYLVAFRTLEVGVASFTPTFARPVLPGRVDTSMVVTGPFRYRAALSAGRGVRAAEVAQASNAKAAMRHALNGGRETIVRSVAADSKAVGWARTTSGRPCAFCAMLASRGPVFKGGGSFAKSDPRFVGPGKVRVHDGCHCGVEPVYRSDAERPAGSRRYRDLWQKSTRGFAGGDAVNAFRRALAAT